MAENNRGRGRPSEYKPEYCKVVIECGKVGKSRISMAIACGASSKETLVDWAKKNPDFSAALDMATQLSQEWWEEMGRVHLVEEHQGSKVNAGLYSRSMAARFPQDWREKSETTLSNPDGSGLSFVIGRHESKNAKD